MGHAAKQLRRDRSAFDDGVSIGLGPDVLDRPFSQEARAVVGSTGDSDPIIEVRASDPLIEIHDSAPIIEVEETEGPWCVDLGDAIECMNSVQIWTALAAGKLTPQIKVWRDGRPCWLPIAEVDELTCEPEQDEPFDVSTPSTSQVVPRTRPRSTSGGETDSEAPCDQRTSVLPRPAASCPGTEFRAYPLIGGKTESFPLLPRTSRSSRTRREVGRWFASVQRAIRKRGRHPRWIVAFAALLVAASFALFYGWRSGVPDPQDMPQLRRVAVDVAERSRFHADRLRDRLTRRSQLPSPDARVNGTLPLE